MIVGDVAFDVVFRGVDGEMGGEGSWVVGGVVWARSGQHGEQTKRAAKRRVISGPPTCLRIRLFTTKTPRHQEEKGLEFGALSIKQSLVSWSLGGF